MSKVIYVTGAPASGKSTTTKLLLERVEAVEVWEYGARLVEHLRKTGVDIADQDELREKSSRLAVAAAVDRVDDALLEFVGERRGRGHVVIDSHPVTREHHGFRITAFSHDRFRLLAPDEIWCFYTAPEVAVARIAADPRGRPMVDVETARMHTMLQASVAATYGIVAGCPVYLFDTDRDQESLVRS
ncbi:adenylate kinase [Sphingomonas guangdongensis]|uniref:Adenylate kinase n=1 Tax=Sphingomonas guangdongensis TaxID=1141890 RepID=A0A285QGW6_9SPHN|nr:AAA family ATPase [Sphingomonas guangdongensis]SOB80704.1 adenylate kinase [Sphingomonas guangdongensis]